MVFHVPECTAFAINLELQREKRKTNELGCEQKGIKIIASAVARVNL